MLKAMVMVRIRVGYWPSNTLATCINAVWQYLREICEVCCSAIYFCILFRLFYIGNRYNPREEFFQTSYINNFTSLRQIFLYCAFLHRYLKTFALDEP